MKKLPFLVFLVIINSCANEDIGISRGFYMGELVDINCIDSSDLGFSESLRNSEILYVSLKEYEFGFQYFVKDSFQTDVHNKWSEKKYQLLTNRKICLAASPLSLFTEGEFLKDNIEYIDKDSSHKSRRLSLFHDKKIRQAYLEYCKHLIDFFGPSYFNMGENVNELFLNNPERWPDFVSFHQYIYLQLKTLYPNLCVFSSVTAEPLLDGVLLNNDFVLQRLAALQIIYYSDLYALSISNNCINSVVSLNRKNAFQELLSISEKPLALSLACWPHDEIEASSASSQKLSNGLTSLFSSCFSHETVFVVKEALLKIPVTEIIHAQNLTTRNETWEKYFGLDFKK